MIKTLLLAAGLLVYTLLPVLALSPVITPGVTPTFANKAWVDSVNGSDSTGLLARQDKPFATVSAAFTAVIAATGNWTVFIQPGSYTDTGLIPMGASYNIESYWSQGSYWTATSSNALYDLTGVTANKSLMIRGNGRFYGSATQTGQFLNSTFGTTAISNIIIEADKIEPGTAVTTFFNLRATLNTSDLTNGSTLASQRNEINVATFGNSGATPSYFRLGSTAAAPFVYIKTNYIGACNFDLGNFIISTGYAEAFKLGPNAFGTPALNLKCIYRFKGTAQPALEVRSGVAIIDAPNLEVTDGSAPIIKITSDASTSGSGVRVTVREGRFRQWAGGSSPAILFDSVNANFRVRLHNCEFLIENTATSAITTTGSNAQTIEAIGSLTSNLALDGDITVRGATPVVDAALWSDF